MVLFKCFLKFKVNIDAILKNYDDMVKKKQN